MENVQNSAQPTQPVQPSGQLSPKEIEIKEKKDVFHKKVRFAALGILGFILLIILLSFVRIIYNKTKDTYVVNPETGSTAPEQEVIIVEEIPAEVEEWEIYSSGKYHFSFDYPKGDALIVSDLSPEEFSVEIRSSNIVPSLNPDGENLVEGYIFRIIPLKLSTSNLGNAAKIKRDWYVSLCPKTSTISPATNKTAAQLKAVGFDIFDCNSDYFITYIAANDYVYEIMQIFKGDLGFKQIYKSRTNQILSSLVVDENLPEASPTVLYQNKSVGFTFKYPRTMNSKCCVVPAPPQKNLTNLITLAENDNSDSIGFFHPRRYNRITLDEYVGSQKIKLADEYAIVKNKTPEGTETEMVINGQRAIMLSGYSWRGNDLIYISLPRTQNVLIISKMGVSEETFNIIIDSLDIK